MPSGRDVSTRPVIGLGFDQRVPTEAVQANLQVTAVGDVTLNESTNDFDTVAVELSPGSLTLADANDVTIGTVATSGISTGGGSTGGSVTVNAVNGTITVDQAVTTTTGSGGGISLNGSLEVNAAVTSGAGTITLNGLTSGAADLLIDADVTTSGALSLSDRRYRVAAGARRGPRAAAVAAQ